MDVYLGDWVLGVLQTELGDRPPERGGALLGPPGRPLLTRFEPDAEALSSPASYAPSRALSERVKELERCEGLEFKGIAHSHPRSLCAPSRQDERELASGLLLNGHLPCYLAPIVTVPAQLALEGHELALGRGKISFFTAYRDAGAQARIVPTRVRLVPLERDLARLASELGGSRPEIFLSDAGTGPLLAGRLVLAGGLEILLLASELYPLIPPLVLATSDGHSEQVPLAFLAATPQEDRLLEAMRRSFIPPGPYRRAFGPPSGRALTRDPKVAALAGFEVRYSAEDAEAAGSSLGEARLARGSGLVTAALRGRSALVCGCGSVGSYLAEQLVRTGLGGLALVDPEDVEDVNLSRTVYEAEDVGRSKVEALARRLVRVDPASRLELHPKALEALHPSELDRAVRACDLVVAATDDPAAQRTLNRFAYARGKPALFVGLYAGAQGGEVLFTLPERTPCYLCATRARHAVEATAGEVSEAVDYGTHRLAGESALGADVQHVSSAALKLALALLAPGSRLGGFAEEAAANGETYLTLSTVPRYWFYPRIFGDTPGQGAYQSVWLTPTRLADCPVCGDREGREDPLETPLRAPREEAFQAFLGEGGTHP
ncbi:MAG TPA: ThiF family adenylyltransferase [Anaeromyxobacteraceae bacterium]|nr:ThiF family adenylyltransferase [Anaeromyxobacteraceae bacterium]